MIPLAASILELAGEALGDYLPRLGSSLVVLVLGLLLARLLSRLLTRVLLRAGLDRLAERARIHDVLARAGLERSLSRLIAVVLRVALTFAVVFAAVSLLRIDALDGALDEGVLFLPKLLAALALALAGMVLGSLVRQRVDRMAYQMDLRGPLGPAAQTAVLAVFGVVALGQLGIPTAILTVLAGILTAGAVLTFTLAFGLGSRDLARDVSAGRYVTSTFDIGQEITLRNARGEIAAIDTASTLLALSNGETLRIPNHLFLESEVRIHQHAPGDTSGSV